MFQPKDTDWLNGYKKQIKKDPYICCLQKKTSIYAVYKRSTSDLGIHTDSK